MRVCSEVGCPTLVPTSGRCPVHQRARDKARGTNTQRGYGPAHWRAKAAIQARINAGEVILCWRCGTRLGGRAWHLDHNEDRTEYRGPSCEQCNLHLAGRARHGLPGVDAK